MSIANMSLKSYGFVQKTACAFAYEKENTHSVSYNTELENLIYNKAAILQLKYSTPMKCSTI